MISVWREYAIALNLTPDAAAELLGWPAEACIAEGLAAGHLGVVNRCANRGGLRWAPADGEDPAGWLLGTGWVCATHEQAIEACAEWGRLQNAGTP